MLLMSFFGLTYSVLTALDDVNGFGMDREKRSFRCHLFLMQSSTKAIKPVDMITLYSDQLPERGGGV